MRTSGTTSKMVQEIMGDICPDGIGAEGSIEKILCLRNTTTFPPFSKPTIPQTLPPVTFPPYSPKPPSDDNIFQEVVSWIGKGVEYFTGGINGELFRLLFTGLLVVAVWRMINRLKQRRNRE